MYKVLSLIKFIFKSIGRKIFLSPMVSNLVINCLHSKTDMNMKKIYNRIRKKLLSDTNYIIVTDYGEGSKVLKGNVRQISRIARYAGIRKRKGELLIRLMNYLKPKNILEIGTSVGLGTACLALGSNNSKIITLEGCPETMNVAENLFKEYNLNNIKTNVGRFQDTLSDVIWNKKFDFIYFDGNHSKKPTIQYFEQCLSTVHDGTLFLFDDIYWSREMEKAWEYIMAHKMVSCTFDISGWGLVFFEPKYIKEHHCILV